MNAYRNSFCQGRPGDARLQILFQDQIDRYTEIGTDGLFEIDELDESEPIGLLSHDENIDIAVRGVSTTRAASKHPDGVNPVAVMKLAFSSSEVFKRFW